MSLCIGRFMGAHGGWCFECSVILPGCWEWGEDWLGESLSLGGPWFGTGW